MKSLTTACVTALALLAGATAAGATPVIGNPINGPATLNTNPGPGNFDVIIGSHDGSQGAQFGNGTWSGTAAACTAIGDPAGCGDNQEIVTLNTNWIGNNNTANGSSAASPFTTGGFWVSFADTGVVGNDGNPQTIFNDPVNEIENGTYTYTFSFTTGDTMAHMGMWVYADDTAEVFISGNGIVDDGSMNPNDTTNDGRVLISLPEATSTDAHCGPGAVGGIGCQPGEQAFIEMFWLNPNTTYTIEIETIQLSQRAFGLLFAGGLQNVPEPATMAILGLGMLGMGAVRRRRRAA